MNKYLQTFPLHFLNIIYYLYLLFYFRSNHNIFLCHHPFLSDKHILYHCFQLSFQLPYHTYLFYYIFSHLKVIQSFHSFPLRLLQFHHRHLECHLYYHPFVSDYNILLCLPEMFQPYLNIFVQIDQYILHMLQNIYFLYEIQIPYHSYIH